MDSVGIEDVSLVGGKNASLGEMLKHLSPKGVRVPSGFIVTAEAYRLFLREAGLVAFIKTTLKRLDTKNLSDLARAGATIRAAVKSGTLPKKLEEQIIEGYHALEKQYGARIDVAVRSSATAEDLPGASFAGEHETYLGVRGTRDLLHAVRSAMASLFTDRAISYREDKGFSHFDIALSVAVQRMVRSDRGASGVMFTVDTESGFKDAVVINGSWGLGEMIVQGEVIPDEFIVFKKMLGVAPMPIVSKRLGMKENKMIYSTKMTGIRPVRVVRTSKEERERFTLSDKEVLVLAAWGKLIEEHYSKKRKSWTPMDMEWAKDGKTGELFIVQARPETVQASRDFSKMKRYALTKKAEPLVRGISVGAKIASGKARVILDAKHIGQFKKGEVLVTDMTDPDWEPIMKIASAIVTDKGGRTSHAAIVSRELGIPAVVGAEYATRKIKTGDLVTVDTTGTEGTVMRGALPFRVTEYNLAKIPKTKTHIMVNIATPDSAFEKSFLPHRGVGLAREEFIISGAIGVHPLAILEYAKLDAPLKRRIEKKARGWNGNYKDFYIDNLAYGIGTIGAAFYPHPVIVRFSDFKTNEYRTLIGGERYEPVEENPMLGWRGASRYYDPKFKDAFLLECLAIKKVREEMGLTNVIPMVPFCRTPQEGIETLNLMARAGLHTKYIPGAKKKNAETVPVYVMCEIPSNVLLAEEFLNLFDGMSIGSNDLTQLVLGLDRDSGIVSHVANENNEAVKKMIAEIIHVARKKKKYIGICGQAPSDYPDFAAFLVREGIESMSLNPDSVVSTTLAVAKVEKKLKR